MIAVWCVLVGELVVGCCLWFGVMLIALFVCLFNGVVVDVVTLLNL